MSAKTKTSATSKAKAKATTKPKAKATTKPKAKATTKPKAKATTKPKAKPKSPSSKTIKPTTSFDYQTLFQRAREQIPREVFEQPRFRIPRVDSFVQGTRTVIRNFKDIVDTLRREPTHLIRYLSRELATAGEVRGRQAMFNGRFGPPALDDLIERYTAQYVLCPICNRPDTEIRREERLLQLVCSACGGRTPLKG